MITLQLAEAIARAILRAVDQDEIALAPHDTYFTDTGQQGSLAATVMDVLRADHVWFCRLSEGPLGETVQQTLPLE